MNKKTAALFLSCLAFFVVQAQTVLKKGMVIKRSVKIKRGIYEINGSDSLSRPVLIIEGSNIVVDFNGAVLSGSAQKTKPDEYFGLAILVRKGSNITIKNLTARRYKLALLARNIKGLKIRHCNFSYNYRQHLNSTQEREDLSDWMSYHRNEKDEWLRYGAAIYLRGCSHALVNDCKVTGGQNALMLMECSNGLFYNNDFSFNSGIGIGMYRCKANRVLYNKVNFNVRGYSHGVYSRGQDSGGILVYEQSSDNLFYKNSATHSGDGFFLWAGQYTMDSGKGGCNDNLIRENDFSYAPANGIEITFSRNEVLNNRIFECDHGIWGGYSHHTAIVGNQFRNNRIAIAIEHGQHNTIENNIFFRDREGIRLWSGPGQHADWGYAKYHDTRSVDYTVDLNNFTGVPLVYNFWGTDSVHFFTNLYQNYERLLVHDSALKHIDSSEVYVYEKKASEPKQLDARDPFKGAARLAGRKNIMITEWGPYDFRYPLIWNTNPADTGRVMQFNILGPKGKWMIVSAQGLENISVMSDSIPASIRATKTASGRTDIRLLASYDGPGFTDAFGETVAATQPYLFTFRKFFQPIDFTVNWFAFDSSSNPLRFPSLDSLQHTVPVKTERTKQLDYAWWDGIRAGDIPYKQFLTVAEGDAEFLSGDYILSLTWDDALRVYVDGLLMVDEWNPSKYDFDQSPNRRLNIRLEAGRHHFKVEHVELGGFATLSLQLQLRDTPTGVD